MTNRARDFLSKAEDLLPRLPADSFDSIVTDPPYNLSDSGKRDTNCLRRIVAEFVFPDHDERDAKGGQRSNLPVPATGRAPLGGEYRAVREDARVGVPEGAVHLNGASVSQQEVNVRREPAERITENDLSAVSDASGVENSGYYVLKLTDAGNAPFCDGTCSCFTEPGTGLVTVDVSISAAGGDLSGSYLGRPGRGHQNVGPLDYTRSETERSPTVLTGRRTETRAVLRLDLARRTGELRFADRAGECGPLFTLEPAQPVGALTGARRFTAEPESSGVGLVNVATGGAFSLYFPWHAINSTRQAGGFMNKKWDGWDSPASFQRWCKAWVAECYRVLKPGGYLAAFGGTRTYHRLACAIEDGGFEIRDSLHWIYGSGFPKGLDVSKAIDKANGNPLAFREFARAYAKAVSGSSLTHAGIDEHLGIKASSCYWAREDHRGGMPPRRHWDRVRDLLGLDGSLERLYVEAERAVVGFKERGFIPGGNSVYGQFSGDTRLTVPATDEAQRWQGWNVALKPAHEPIILARKPLSEGTVAANVLRWGTGALNVDGCKVGTETRTNNAGGASSLQRVSRVEQGYRPTVTESRNEDSEVAGRWPPNLLLTHSADCQPAGTRKVKAITGTAAGKMAAGKRYRTSMGSLDGSDRAHEQTGYADADGMETVQAFICARRLPGRRAGRPERHAYLWREPVTPRL